MRFKPTQTTVRYSHSSQLDGAQTVGRLEKLDGHQAEISGRSAYLSP